MPRGCRALEPRSFAAAAIALAGLVLTSEHVATQAIERSLVVSVLDKAGAPVLDISPTDIVVREDGVAREVLRVGPVIEPMEVAILVDNSQAAEPFIRDYREALPRLIGALTEEAETGRRNSVSVIALGERPTILTDYTFDRAALLKGVERIFSQSGSGTYFLDGIIEVSRGITKRQPARPVIVAILTEGPELSDRHYQEVLGPLAKAGAALHVVIVGRQANNDTDRARVLDVGTKASGGRYDTILMSTALTSKLKQVAAELTHQHRVVYARPQALIPPEKITVSAARPDLVARGTPLGAAGGSQGRP
jgi:hypothetical protein